MERKLIIPVPEEVIRKIESNPGYSWVTVRLTPHNSEEDVRVYYKELYKEDPGKTIEKIRMFIADGSDRPSKKKLIEYINNLLN